MQNLQYPTLHRSHLRPRCGLSGRRRGWPHAGGRWTLVNDTLAALARQCGSDDEIWNTSVPTTDRDRFARPHGRGHLFGQMRRYMDFNSVGQDDAFDVPDRRQRECLDGTGDVHLSPPDSGCRWRWRICRRCCRCLRERRRYKERYAGTGDDESLHCDHRHCLIRKAGCHDFFVIERVSTIEAWSRLACRVGSASHVPNAQQLRCNAFFKADLIWASAFPTGLSALRTLRESESQCRLHFLSKAVG